jgi:hypothetical protein
MAANSYMTDLEAFHILTYGMLENAAGAGLAASCQSTQCRIHHVGSNVPQGLHLRLVNQCHTLLKAAAVGGRRHTAATLDTHAVTARISTPESSTSYAMVYQLHRSGDSQALPDSGTSSMQGVSSVHTRGILTASALPPPPAPALPLAAAQHLAAPAAGARRLPPTASPLAPCAESVSPLLQLLAGT